jgi:hypothetical protein
LEVRFSFQPFGHSQGDHINAPSAGSSQCARAFIGRRRGRHDIVNKKNSLFPHVSARDEPEGVLYLAPSFLRAESAETGRIFYSSQDGLHLHLRKIAPQEICN